MRRGLEKGPASGPGTCQGRRGPIQYKDHVVEKTFFPTDILGFRAKVFEILGLEADDPDLICKLGIDKGKQWLKVNIIQQIFCV